MHECRSLHANSQVAGVGGGGTWRGRGSSSVVTLLFALDFIGEFKIKSCEDSKSALFVQVLLSLHILEEKEKLFLDSR